MSAWRIWFGAALVVGGDIALRRWSLGGSRWQLVLGALLYAASSLVWAWQLRLFGELARGAALWSVIALVMAVVAGLVIFGERLGAPQWAGVALAIAAIVLLGSDR